MITGNISKFEIVDSTLKLKIKGNTIEGEFELQKQDSLVEKFSIYFDIEYFTKISKAISIFDELYFYLAKDSPCKLMGNGKKIKLQWYLAPRVEDE